MLVNLAGICLPGSAILTSVRLCVFPDPLGARCHGGDKLPFYLGGWILGFCVFLCYFKIVCSFASYARKGTLSPKPPTHPLGACFKPPIHPLGVHLVPIGSFNKYPLGHGPNGPSIITQWVTLDSLTHWVTLDSLTHWVLVTGDLDGRRWCMVAEGGGGGPTVPRSRLRWNHKPREKFLQIKNPMGSSYTLDTPIQFPLHSQHYGTRHTPRHRHGCRQ
jgi:hypothetical protein